MPTPASTTTLHRPTLALLAALALLGLAALPATAAVHTEEVRYAHGDTELVGYLAYDDAIDPGDARPGVLVVHEWWGLNDHAKSKARALAEEGYVALALDMYGDGRNTEHPEQAGEWAGAIRENEQRATERFMAAYELLQGHERVDSERIGAIGYCFGGHVVLRMAQEGVDLDAVVSFHGSLPTGEVEQGAVEGAVLVAHGSADPLVSREQIQTFRDAMTAAGADWMMYVYGGAKHSFTNEAADGSVMEALQYDPAADRRSWRAMLALFEEVWG